MNRFTFMFALVLTTTIAAAGSHHSLLGDASAATVQTFFSPAGDARVQKAYPNTNYGASTKLTADTSPVIESFVRFSVQGTAGQVEAAKLRLYVTDGSKDGPVVYATGASWSESAMTWNTRPALTTGALGNKFSIAKGWTEYDVSGVVKGNGTYGFALVGTSSDGLSASSREALSTYRPQLVLSTSSTTTADTAAPSVSIASPASGTTYTSAQTVAVAALAADDVGVARVEFSDNGVLKGTEDTSPFTYSWSITSGDNGIHRWTARAFDAAGNGTTSAPVDVTVSISTSTPPVSSGGIVATVETDPVANAGDAADDPAVWIHPSDTSKSTIIGTDKLGGLAVYDLAGKQLYYYGGIRPNNVDLRYGFSLGGQATTIVTASERDTDAIVAYRVNPTTRGLENVAARTLSIGMGASGLCMYRSAKTGKHYVFVGDSSGTVQQWELFESAGKVDARKVRTLSHGSTTEGCVADDELGHLYVAEEDVAIWKYGAEPETGTTRVKVDAVGTGGQLTADIEGLSLYYGTGGKGYLLASSQGSNDFAVYERQGANAYVARFAVGAGAIDAVSYTDGLDVTNAPLGSAFPEGAFVAQDDRNDAGNQNFKLVPWGKIARSLGPQLTIDTGWDPRTGAAGASTEPTSPTSPPPPPPETTTGTTYYVDSTAGSDANNGTSQGTAWKTLAKASAASLAPGDRLLLARGGSWIGTLELVESGTSAAPISVGAYGTGALPLVQGATNCVKLSGSHLVLRDVHAHDCSWAGVYLSGSENRVEANVITRNAAGVYVRAGSAGSAILGNEIRDNNKMSVLSQIPADDDSGAFGIALHGDATEIAYNTISGSDAFSYDYGRDGAAIEVYGGQRNHIHHNLAVDNDAFSELGHPRAADNTFSYNVVRSSLETSVGLVTRGAGSSYGPVLRTSLYNNTIYMTGAASQGFVCHAGCGADILRMRNNVVQAVWKVGYADGAFDGGHDVFWGGQRQFQLGANSVVADPRFLDPAAGNLRLQGASPAVDRGLGGLGYSEDFDRLSVPVDGDGDGVAHVDVGAFEYRR